MGTPIEQLGGPFAVGAGVFVLAAGILLFASAGFGWIKDEGIASQAPIQSVR